MSEKAMQGDIVDRLRGRYPCGPRLPNGEPEFGWREFDPDALAHLLKKPSAIMGEAANEIEDLRRSIDELLELISTFQEVEKWNVWSTPDAVVQAVKLLPPKSP